MKRTTFKIYFCFLTLFSALLFFGSCVKKHDLISEFSIKNIKSESASVIKTTEPVVDESNRISLKKKSNF